jgi:hypothetical protein
MLTCFTFLPNLASAPPPGGGFGDGMAEYRVYLVDRDDHFFDVIRLVSADDAEAIQRAQELAVGHGVELWEFDRKIAVFPDQNKTL